MSLKRKGENHCLHGNNSSTGQARNLHQCLLCGGFAGQSSASVKLPVPLPALPIPCFLMKSFQKNVGVHDDAPQMPVSRSSGTARASEALDRSPRQIHARTQLKAMFGQAAFSTCVSAKPVVQRAIAETKLNVAGEDHDESDGRRPSEKQFALERAKGGYWTEEEFKNSSGSAADPTILRLYHALWRGFSDAPKIKKLTDFMLTLKSMEPYLENIKDILTVLIDSLGLYLLDDALTYTTMLAPEESKSLDNLADFLLECQKQRHEALVLCERLQVTVRDSDEKGFLAQVPTLCTLIDEFEAGAKLWTEKLQLDDRDTNLKRSIAMHAAANGKSTSLGVWKVGDQHVKDMNKLDSHQYNLVSKDDFNAEFGPWANPPKRLIIKIKPLSNPNVASPEGTAEDETTGREKKKRRTKEKREKKEKKMKRQKNKEVEAQQQVQQEPVGAQDKQEDTSLL